MNSVSPHATIAEILATPFSKADLDEHLIKDARQRAFVAKFDNAWVEFVLTRTHHDELPLGEREMRIDSMQQEVKDLEVSTELVQLELVQQLSFLQTSRQALEEMFQAKIKDALERRHVKLEELSRRLVVTLEVDVLQSKTIPWLYYLDQWHRMTEDRLRGDPDLMRMIAMANVDDNDSSSVASRGTASTTESFRRSKPSNLALMWAQLLLRKYPEEDVDEWLLAYRIDQAVLSTHAYMLGRELERYEVLIQSQEWAGKFLTDHNVWGILKRSGGGDGVGHASIGPLATASVDGVDDSTVSTSSITVAQSAPLER